jgi:hypothetical protein
MRKLLPIDATTYQRSALHGDDRIWQETNCYVDLWIELLHALDLPVEPALTFTVSSDFEGDQWQFIKFPLEDLRTLYGLDVAEMNPWRGVEHHVVEQLDLGRFVTTEVDSWYLPDTAGVSYQIEHVKTSIVPNMIDPQARRLGYFHGASYYELEGDDYVGLFHVDDPQADRLAPYVELVKIDRVRRPDVSELVVGCRTLLEVHLARRPADNPLQRFRERLKQDLEWLSGTDLATFHGYAFTTLRQFGACAELAGSLSVWLDANGVPNGDAAAHFVEASTLAKSLQFSLARFMSGRNVDLDAPLTTMQTEWDEAMSSLAASVG